MSMSWRIFWTVFFGMALCYLLLAVSVVIYL
jgi:hypothetical protein